MERQELRPRLRALYPAFEALDDARLDALLDECPIVNVEAGTVLFDDRSPCEALPLLVEGIVRVSKAGASGRELQLYRVVPGEACILTSSCLLGKVAYNARGVAETGVVAVAVPQPVFQRLLSAHEPFQYGAHGLAGAIRITSAGEHGPRLGNRIDLAFAVLG